jgi:lipopolysaccharide transport system permease protein
VSVMSSELGQKDLPLTVIKPSSGWAGVNFKELWRYRELIYFLIWRDIKVRYKQTLLGAAWAILQPFISMVVFTLFFGRLAGIPTDDIPAPIFYYAGLLPWQFFQSGIGKAGNSLVSGRNLLTKVYFPRLSLPISPIFAGFVDFGLAFIVLIGMIIYYKIQLTWAILTIPLFLLLTMVVALGVGLWLSALNVAYRDIGYVIPFLTQTWFFITPIVYSTTIIPESYQILYGLNPMAGVVQGMRWAIVGTGAPSGISLAISVTVSIFLLITGAFYFRRMERTFADVV